MRILHPQGNKSWPAEKPVLRFSRLQKTCQVDCALHSKMTNVLQQFIIGKKSKERAMGKEEDCGARRMAKD